MPELRGLTIQLPDGRVEDYRLSDVVGIDIPGGAAVKLRDGRKLLATSVRFYPQSEAPGSPGPLGVDTIGEQG